MLIAAGRDADVFEHGDGLILRRYRNGRSADAEAAVLRGVHALGYPVPRVESVAGPDLVMERIDGVTVADALLGGRISVAAAAELIADLHNRLHRLEWAGAEALLHLDLHPQNVMLAAAGPVVIDWSNARPGPAGLDAAVTALIMAMLAEVPGMAGGPPEIDELVRAVAVEFLTVFGARIDADLWSHLDEAVALRRADRNTSPEEAAVLDQATELIRRTCLPTFAITAVPAEAVRPYRLEWLRRGTASEDVAFAGDDEPATVHLLATAPGGAPVGVATWMHAASPDRPGEQALQLRGMASDPTRRRQGAGRALIDAGLTLAAERNLPWVWANARDTALDFYVACGFEVVGDGFITADTNLPHHRILRAV